MTQLALYYFASLCDTSLSPKNDSAHSLRIPVREPYNEFASPRTLGSLFASSDERGPDSPFGNFIRTANSSIAMVTGMLHLDACAVLIGVFQAAI